nr:hypothetical protein [uncultured Bdellovibrio sp.]
MKSVFLVLIFFSTLAHAQESATTTITTTTTTTTVQSAPTEESKTTVEDPDDDDDDEKPIATSTASVEKPRGEFPKFEFKSYGYISFSQHETFKTVQNLEPIVRRQMDLAEFAFEGEYILTENSKIEFEVEIEHGGVGTAVEFDPFEEFGEFEQEIEKGGEVVLHEVYYKKSFKYDTTLKVGKFPLFISLGSVLTKPHRYPSILPSDVEARMIPLGWTETGVQIEQKYGPFTGRLGVVTGLNSEFFRTYNWVGGGYQRHFETMNADDLATVGSLEFGNVAKGHGIAIAAYKGDTTKNRYKVDKLKDTATVTIWSLLGSYKLGKFGVQGQMILGELDNADKVSQANATLGGLAKPKAFAPLGSKARLESVQVSYDALEDLTFYLKQEHVDTFADVAGNINKNPRYNMTKKSAGLMWMWDTAAFMKVQYSREKTELEGLPETYQANIAFGFDLDRFN